VIVDHPDRLHVRVDDGRADERESTPLQVLAEGVGFGRGCRDLPHRLPAILPGAASDESPAVRVEASEFFLDCEKRLCVTHRSLDLHAVSNDRRVGHELLNAFVGEPRHSGRIEIFEGAAITLPFSENDRPAQPRLRPFEQEELEVLAVVVDRDAPFRVVVAEHQRIGSARPLASFRAHVARRY
jgi:hypothetical protein